MCVKNPNTNSYPNKNTNITTNINTDGSTNVNTDGAEANNTVTMTVDYLRPTIAISANKTQLGPNEVATVTCACGSSFQTRTTQGDMKVELCSVCHPFFTGKQKILDTGGRVARFEARYAKKKAEK